MLIPGQEVPDLSLPLTIQARFELSKQKPRNFTLLIFYRGSHCPICRKYLEEIAARLGDITDAGLSPFAICMDSEERAMVVDRDWQTGDLPLVYDLTEDEARRWGLYISSQREGSKEPETFSEPGLFLIRPDMTLFFAQVQSGPFTRPSIDQLLEGVKLVVEKDYPARGTAT